MTTHCKALLAGALFLIPAAATAQEQESGWLQNFADAKAKAQAEKKDLLVDFTGSDWCIWCQRLDKEVFAQSEFQDAAPKDFVLVKLDFPKDDSLVTPEIKAQNEQLQQEYSIEGFPTIFLMDASGRPYAQTGYQQGGAAKYLSHLAELKQAHTTRDEHFAKAAQVEGVERAKELAAGLEAVGEQLAPKYYGDEVKQIIALDADNAAGLKAHYEELLDRAQQEKIVQGLQAKLQELAPAGKWDEVTAAMDKALQENKGKKLVEQMATFYKAIAAIEGKQDFDAGIALIDQAKAIDPDSEMGRRLDGMKKNVEKMRDSKKEEGDKGGAGKDGAGQGNGGK